MLEIKFELALYTLCFMCGAHNEPNLLQLGPYAATITCHTWPPNSRPGQPIYIATSFPGEAPLDENEVRNQFDFLILQLFEILLIRIYGDGCYLGRCKDPVVVSSQGI